MVSENLVLLVEDDAPLKRSLEKFLNTAGYLFRSCSTAAQALALAKSSAPRVVILEYHLPDANGCSLIYQLNLVVPGIIAIVLSEFDFQAVACNLNRVNIQTFLQKPFDLVDFEAALCSACFKSGKIVRRLDSR
ncbi:MAG: response regulator [Syntrophobacteraceae bacterium]|nr:response regulator [Syntrophobacteraceae bacterium]